jgi:hypothetical protein
MSRLYLFPLCSVTRTVWSSVRLETHVDKVPARNAAKRVGYAPRSRATARARMRATVVGHAISVRDPARFLRCRTFVNAALSSSSSGNEFGSTCCQVHEMQSGLDRFAFAIARPVGYQGDAFQASSPKNFQGRFWRPLFLSERGRHSVSGAPSYRTFAYSDRLSSSMLIGVGVIQSAPRIGYGP